MKKVILAVDGTNFSAGAFRFIRALNEKSPLLVAGVFVPQLDYENLWNYPAAAGAGAVYVPLVEEENNEAVAENIAMFEEKCQRNGILYRVHRDVDDFALPELKRESRFADVMILGGELFYRNVVGVNRFDYLKNVLHLSECPVLIVPEDYGFPETNILAYDGSEESVYAIKQFAYVFPELAGNKTLLVHVNDEDTELPLKDQIVELATQHYPDLTFYNVKLNPKKYFTTWLGNHRDAILVSGSFSRSAFSQLFKKSFVADIINSHRLPVFVAHK